jgi:hypothetical protein
VITDIRNHTIEQILSKQDDSFRWGFDEKQARERPEYVYYSPNFKSTLWTLILLADIKAPVDTPQIKPSIQLITERFYDPEREEVFDRRMSRALKFLRSKMKEGGFWELEKAMNILVPIGQKARANAFITERATAVLEYYGWG